MNRRDTIKWIKSQPIPTEIEKIKINLKKRLKICRNCNSVYGYNYSRCSNCGSEKLDILGTTVLKARLVELEKLEREKLGSDV